MEDDKGPDAKIICVPPATPGGTTSQDIAELPELPHAEIEHFFDMYKTLEPGKYSNTRGYEGVDAAWKEIRQPRARRTTTPI